MEEQRQLEALNPKKKRNKRKYAKSNTDVNEISRNENSVENQEN